MSDDSKVAMVTRAKPEKCRRAREMSANGKAGRTGFSKWFGFHCEWNEKLLEDFKHQEWHSLT